MLAGKLLEKQQPATVPLPHFVPTCVQKGPVWSEMSIYRKNKNPFHEPKLSSARQMEPKTEESGKLQKDRTRTFFECVG